MLRQLSKYDTSELRFNQLVAPSDLSVYALDD